MKLLSQIFVVYIWIIASVLVYFLFAIARFFNRRRREKTLPAHTYPIHHWLIAAIAFFLVAALLYTISGSIAVAGVAVADVLRIIGGAVVILVGYSLMNSMLGGRP